MFGKKTIGGKLCGFDKKPCIKERCVHWVHLYGVDPQTGNPVDEFGCSFAWQPILQIETASEVRKMTAATETLRNVLAEHTKRMNVIESARNRIFESAAERAAADPLYRATLLGN